MKLGSLAFSTAKQSSSTFQDSIKVLAAFQSENSSVLHCSGQKELKENRPARCVRVRVLWSGGGSAILFGSFLL